eukprot:TRINITY_DN4279_c0_g2_i2.p1 TRINITY_DN4279_c0_g2~~TRINITY_DN4279_c0_g2_i2.p1  ORF type:complete len:305 (+),score=64.48 TRINITY_DN4279_c0_g2_i2:24-917(+)
MDVDESTTEPKKKENRKNKDKENDQKNKEITTITTTSTKSTPVKISENQPANENTTKEPKVPISPSITTSTPQKTSYESVPVGGNKLHLLFDDDDRSESSIQSTSSAKVLLSSVHLRIPTKRPTVESWQATGWRRYVDYQTPKPKKGKKRRRNKANNSTTENQQITPIEDTSTNQTTVSGTQNITEETNYYEKYGSDFSTAPLYPTNTIPMEGMVVAYKIFEVSHRWEPGLSDWKCAKVIQYDESTSNVQLEILPKSLDPSAEQTEDLNAFYYEIAGVDNIVEVSWNELQYVRLLSQ